MTARAHSRLEMMS